MTKPGRLLAFILALLTVPVAAIAQTADSDAFTLKVLLRGAAIGDEVVVVNRTGSGWTVSSASRLGAPLMFELRNAELKYAPDWAALSMSMEGSVRNEVFAVSTTIANGLASSNVLQGTNRTTKTDAVSDGTILLPNNFYGAYVALARALVAATPGTALKAYVAPQAEIALTVDSVAEDRLQTADRTFTARRVRLTMANPGGPLPVDLWSEPDGRLVRISIPAAQLDVVREDVASSAARQLTFYREGDEDVRIAANGFNLAATISRPKNPATPKVPAVVLVAGSGPMGRDEVVAGIPIFGQLASQLADAGYFVVRYDKRGVGQSGGRVEAVTLQDYADDVRAVLKFVDSRKDVDDKRIFLVGHSEGGWVSMLAAAADDRVAGIALCGVPSGTGADLVVEQQRAALESLTLTYAEREEKLALQRRINQAVVTGQGWEAVTSDLRRQADTPWFRSFLMFDPAVQMPRVKVPVLVVQGERDRQVVASHGQKLAALAKARKKDPGASVVAIAGVNHLFVPAATGAVAEYASLPTRDITPEWSKSLVAWMSGIRQ